MAHRLLMYRGEAVTTATDNRTAKFARVLVLDRVVC